MTLGACLLCGGETSLVVAGLIDNRFGAAGAWAGASGACARATPAKQSAIEAAAYRTRIDTRIGRPRAL